MVPVSMSLSLFIRDSEQEDKMKARQVFKTIVFVVIFLFLLKTVTYMLRTNGQIKEIFVGFYAEPKDSVDVVMIGSSSVYPYYCAPQIWGEQGITCYPLSSNVQRPIASKYLVKEALKTQTPDLFVFEVRMYVHSDEEMSQNMAYTRGVTDNLKYSWNRIETINAMVADKEERYTYYFDILKYHSNWRSVMQEDQVTSLFYERQHPLKGFEVNDQWIPGEWTDYSMVEKSIPIPEDQENVLRDLLSYLQEQGQDALFVLSPLAMSEEEKMQYNYVEQIVTSYGYHYLDLNDYCENMELNFETDFYDGGSHVNASGSEKCSLFLGEYLAQNYQIMDKRGNISYRMWDEAYERWQGKQKEALAVIADKIRRGLQDLQSNVE